MDADRLEEALRRLMARHAVLRTSFALSGYSRPLQLVHREAAVPLEVVDLRELDEAAQQKALAAWMAAE